MILGIKGHNFSSGTEELIAVWSRAPMIYRSGSWEKAPITLTADQDAEMESFLDHLFLVNGTDPNYSYNESLWSTTTNVLGSPIAKHVKKYGVKLYLFNIQIAGVSYKSRCWMSDLPKNNGITWGLETGDDLAQTADSAVITSAGSSFLSRNIKVGDAILITSGDNAGEYIVQSVDSETQITLTENMANTETNSSFWVGGNWFDVETDDGDIGMGLGLVSNELLLYKKNSTHRFNDRGNELRQIQNMPGTTSTKSIVSVGGYSYSYHPTGIYRTDGGSGQLISEAIYDVIEGVTAANQSNVVAWVEDESVVHFYLGDVTLRDGETIENCVAKFDIHSDSWDLDSIDHEIACATKWLENNIQKIYVGDSGSSVFQMNTGNDFNGEAISFELEDKPRFPAGPDAIVDFNRLRLYVDNGPSVQVVYKLLYRPTSEEVQWISDKDWLPLQGSQRSDRSEWEFPPGERASGIILKFIESSTEESFLIQKYVLYYSNVANK